METHGPPPPPHTAPAHPREFSSQSGRAISQFCKLRNGMGRICQGCGFGLVGGILAQLRECAISPSRIRAFAIKNHMRGGVEPETSKYAANAISQLTQSADGVEMKLRIRAFALKCNLVGINEVSIKTPPRAITAPKQTQRLTKRIRRAALVISEFRSPRTRCN